MLHNLEWVSLQFDSPRMSPLSQSFAPPTGGHVLPLTPVSVTWCALKAHSSLIFIALLRKLPNLALFLAPRALTIPMSWARWEGDELHPSTCPTPKMLALGCCRSFFVCLPNWEEGVLKQAKAVSLCIPGWGPGQFSSPPQSSCQLRCHSCQMESCARGEKSFQLNRKQVLESERARGE